MAACICSAVGCGRPPPRRGEGNLPVMAASAIISACAACNAACDPASSHGSGPEPVPRPGLLFSDSGFIKAEIDPA